MIKDTVDTTLSVAGKIGALASAANADSLIEFTKSTRVEPIVLVENALVQQPYINDALHVLNSIFTAYYLQAVTLLAKVGDVEVIKTLDRLNDERNIKDNAIEYLSNEDYVHGLPDYDSPSVSVEDAAKGFTTLSDASNLAIGKLIEVELGNGKEKVTIPMSVRLNVKTTHSSNLVHILSLGLKDNSTMERYHRWRAGELGFIKDLILCQDLIDANREGQLKDDSGILDRGHGKNNRNTLSALLSQKSSINNASGLLVITADTAKAIEQEMGAKLSRFSKREALFKQTFTMLLMVIDTQWDQVTIYHRSIKDETELSVSDLKTVNKRGGPDILEILKAMQVGNSPRL